MKPDTPKHSEPKATSFEARQRELYAQAEAMGLLQESDETILQEWIKEVAKPGDTENHIIGVVMKAHKEANPVILRRLVKTLRV